MQTDAFVIKNTKNIWLQKLNQIKQWRKWVKKGRCFEVRKVHFLVGICARLSNYKTFYFKWIFKKNNIMTWIYESLMLLIFNCIYYKWPSIFHAISPESLWYFNCKFESYGHICDLNIRLKMWKLCNYWCNYNSSEVMKLLKHKAELNYVRKYLSVKTCVI